jgi:polysaccharide biosynthesis/export protein
VLEQRMMDRLIGFFIVFSFFLGAQACSTSAGIHSTSPALSTEPAGGLRVPRPDLAGGMIPAVVGIPPDPGPARTYRIGPYDLLKIKVFEADELSTVERVNEEGLIDMPLIGAVKVGGLTPREAEQAIAERLRERYLQNPQVDLFVSEYASQKVTVIGHVNHPGVFPLTGRTTMMQAIALAGGVDDVADKQQIVVFRQQESGDVNAYLIDLSAIETGAAADPLIIGNDRVVVPQSGARTLGKSIYGILVGWAARVPFY